MGTQNDSRVTIGGVGFKFSTAILLGTVFHLLTAAFGFGMVWNKLDSRISALEADAKRAEIVQVEERKMSREAIERLARKMDEMAAQLARMEGRMDPRGVR